MHTLNLRSFLWFATGVALTITSIATFGAWRANAAATPGESTFVPVAPCRLFDTRPDQNIADSNTTPIGQTETRTQQVTGQVGNCNIPTGISGVAMNVTIVNPTADSFLVLFPADETTLPVGSNLNWTAGQSPTPNKVDVKLSPDGQVKIFNNTGTVDVLADIVGYYTTTTITQLTSDITALQTAATQDAADIAALETAVAQLTAAGTAQDTAIQQNTDDLLDTNMDVTSLLEGTNVIPSGVTVTGYDGIDSTSVADNQRDLLILDLPGLAPGITAINFAPHPRVTDGDADCTGSDASPTAPPGKICLYVRNTLGLDEINGVFSGVFADSTFTVSLTSNTPGAPAPAEAFLYFTWPYTAP